MSTIFQNWRVFEFSDPKIFFAKISGNVLSMILKKKTTEIAEKLTEIGPITEKWAFLRLILVILRYTENRWRQKSHTQSCISQL